MIPERRLLLAVVRRAFEDIKYLFTDAKDELGLAACLWVQGKAEIVEPEDEFMSFENICSLLRLPHNTMIAYSVAVQEGRHAEFIAKTRGVGTVRDELFILADSSFEHILLGSSRAVWSFSVECSED